MTRYLLVEGRSDVALVKAICRQMGVSTEELQIIDMEGKGGLAKNLAALEPEQTKGAKVAVILDADENARKRRDETMPLLADKNIPLFLLPDDVSSGELETLMLSTVDEHVVLNCFDEYISCLKRDGVDVCSVDNKAKLYAYTTLTSGLVPEKSFDTDLWDYTHTNFQKLQLFLKSFIIEET